MTQLSAHLLERVGLDEGSAPRSLERLGCSRAGIEFIGFQPMSPTCHSLLLKLSCAAAVLLGCGVVAPGARAQESPFLPEGFGAPPPAAAPASALDRYEFRGVLTIGTETFVTLVDTTTSRSFILSPGETLDGLRASDFRPDEGSVQIESGGQTKRLVLREAKIVAMTAPPPPPPQPGAPPMAPGQPPSGPAVAGAPISDEEARQRMQRVAEEIRRRREMRRQMLESQQQGRPANQ